MKLRTLILPLLVAGLAMAFALPAIARTKTATVTVVAREFKFTLSKASVPHGKVVFKVTNRGKLGHDFSIAGHKTAVLKPGKSATLTVTLRKGSWAYKCTVAGHAKAGMQGKLRVT
ncbi:MAG: cupredoxin domain-containing protein [Gaiellaceae bacterium]